jgi:hypothetical protein
MKVSARDGKKMLITWTTIVIDLISFTRYTWSKKKKMGLHYELVALKAFKDFAYKSSL